MSLAHLRSESAGLSLDQVRKRLQRIGLSFNEARYAAKFILRQAECRGIEGACAYLKKVGDQLLFWGIGSNSRCSWVRIERKGWLNGFPSVLLPIVTVRKDPQVLLRFCKFARVLTLESPSPSQLDKVYLGATLPFSGSEASLEMIRSSISAGISSLPIGTVKPVSSFQPLAVTRLFQETVSTGNGSLIKGKPPIAESFKTLARLPELVDPEVAYKMFPPLSQRQFDTIYRFYQHLMSKADAKDQLDDTVGEIHASQEPGCKLRMFAAPFTGVQAAISIIHDWIVQFLVQIPEVCTWNQLRGAEDAQLVLKAGETVWSFDLTTATCRTPLEPQLNMLEALGLPPEYISRLRFVCRGSWKIVSGMGKYNGQSLRWEVGQPLGIRPSMSMFTLWHALLLRGIAMMCARPFRFRILGDDVLIFDPIIAEVYSQLVQTAGIPISWNKSHVSNRYAEFAGASITRENIIRAGKFRPVSRENVLSLVDSFGLLPGHFLKEESKLYLFMLGRYKPLRQEFRRMLIASTYLTERCLVDLLSSVDARKPIWVHRICKEIFLQVSKDLGPVSAPYGDEVSAEKSLVLYVLKFIKDAMPSSIGWKPPFMKVYEILRPIYYSHVGYGPGTHHWWILKDAFNDMLDWGGRLDPTPFLNRVLADASYAIASGIIQYDVAYSTCERLIDEITSWYYTPPRNHQRFYVDKFTEALAFARRVDTLHPVGTKDQLVLVA